MGCWSAIETDEEPDGICPDCGEKTWDGLALEGCSYSPICCETCKHSPCDSSC